MSLTYSANPTAVQREGTIEINDPDAVTARVLESSPSLPVTDSQVLASEEATTGRWPRDEGESGRITRH